MERKTENFFYPYEPGIIAIYNKISFGRVNYTDLEEISKNFVLEGVPVLQTDKKYLVDDTVFFLKSKKCYIARKTGFIYFDESKIKVLPYISVNDIELICFIIIPAQDFTKNLLTEKHVNRDIDDFGIKDMVSQEIAKECIKIYNRSGGYKILYRGSKMIPDRKNDILLDDYFNFKNNFTLLEGRRVLSPKEIEFYHIVNKGDKIGTFKKTIPGSKGMDVFGKEIPCTRIIAFYKKGKGLLENSNGEIVVLQNGILRINKEGELMVKEGLVINRDLKTDLNIEREQDVIITGRIFTNVEIKVKGSLVVLGGVETVNIDCEGDFFLTNGINSRSVIKVGGDCFVQFVANSQISVEGNLWVGQYTLNSDINARKNIIVRTNHYGEIVGGSVRSEEGYIETNSIGSISGTDTFLKVGKHVIANEQAKSDKVIIEEYSNKLFLLEQKLQKVRPLVESAFKRWKTNPKSFSDNETIEFKQKIFNFKELQNNKREIEIKVNELKEIVFQDKATNLDQNEIKAFGGIYSGVTVQINNIKQFFKYNISKGLILKRDPVLPKIVSYSLGKDVISQSSKRGVSKDIPLV